MTNIAFENPYARQPVRICPQPASEVTASEPLPAPSWSVPSGPARPAQAVATAVRSTRPFRSIAAFSLPALGARSPMPPAPPSAPRSEAREPVVARRFPLDEPEFGRELLHFDSSWAAMHGESRFLAPNMAYSRYFQTAEHYRRGLSSLTVRAPLSYANGDFCLSRNKMGAPPRIATIPTELTLALVSLVYKQKYNIDMTVVPVPGDTQEGALVLQAALAEAWEGRFVPSTVDPSTRRGDGARGFLLNTREGHVVPVVLCRQGDNYALVALDSIGPRLGTGSDVLNRVLPQIAAANGILLFRTTTPVQGDLVSCRTISLTALKDALLTLNDPRVRDSVWADIRGSAVAASGLPNTFDIRWPTLWRKVIQRTQVEREEGVTPAELSTLMPPKYTKTLGEYYAAAAEAGPVFHAATRQLEPNVSKRMFAARKGESYEQSARALASAHDPSRLQRQLSDVVFPHDMFELWNREHSLV